MNSNIENEVRFLDVDISLLKTKLAALQAKDFGEKLFQDIIFHDSRNKFGKDETLRLRDKGGEIYLTYKYYGGARSGKTKEIEITVSSFAQTKELLESLGFVSFRQQQKRRHCFSLDGIAVEIDQWPKIPAYVELEGNSNRELKNMAKKLDLDWSKANFKNAAWVIENVYNIPVTTYKYYTFERVG